MSVCSVSGMPCCEFMSYCSCRKRSGQYDRTRSAQYVALAECWVNWAIIKIKLCKSDTFVSFLRNSIYWDIILTRHSAGATCRANLSRSCGPHPTSPLKKNSHKVQKVGKSPSITHYLCPNKHNGINLRERHPVTVPP